MRVKASKAKAKEVRGFHFVIHMSYVILISLPVQGR